MSEFQGQDLTLIQLANKLLDLQQERDSYNALLRDANRRYDAAANAFIGVAHSLDLIGEDLIHSNGRSAPWILTVYEDDVICRIGQDLDTLQDSLDEQ